MLADYFSNFSAKIFKRNCLQKCIEEIANIVNNANIKVTSPRIVSAMFRKLVDKNRKNRKNNYFSKRNNPYKRRKK